MQKKSTKIFLFFFTVLLLLSADRFTKKWAQENLMNQAPQSFFHDSFRFEYVENTGAALSLGDDLPDGVSFWVLSILPLIVLLIVLIYTMKHISKMNAMKVFSLALIFAGGIGNIADRILLNRHVTDFMNMGIGSLRTGIFNVADVGVTAGAIGLLLFYKEKNPVQKIHDNSETVE